MSGLGACGARIVARQPWHNDLQHAMRTSVPFFLGSCLTSLSRSAATGSDRDHWMSFFSDLKAERLIAEIRGIGDPLHPEAQKAFQKLAKIGPGAIPKILDALAVADKKEAASYVEILTQLVDNKTFPMLVAGPDRRQPAHDRGRDLGAHREPQLQPHAADRAARRAMTCPSRRCWTSSRRRSSASRCATCCSTPTARRRTRRWRCSASSASWRTMASIPELISRIEGKDSIARMHIINILSRFNRPNVSAAIQTQLKDPNKLIRAGGAQRAVEDGRPDRRRPGHPAAARPGPRSRRTARSTWWCAPRIRTR